MDAYSLGADEIAFKHLRVGPKAEGPYLALFRFATGKTEQVPTPRQSLRCGIALSPDGRHLLHAQADYEVSNLMLVEGFRWDRRFRLSALEIEYCYERILESTQAAQDLQGGLLSERLWRPAEGGRYGVPAGSPRRAG